MTVPKRPTFTVSPAVQHGFRVLGPGQPGAETAARDALARVHAASLAFDEKLRGVRFPRGLVHLVKITSPTRTLCGRGLSAVGTWKPITEVDCEVCEGARDAALART